MRMEVIKAPRAAGGPELGWADSMKPRGANTNLHSPLAQRPRAVMLGHLLPARPVLVPGFTESPVIWLEGTLGLGTPSPPHPPPHCTEGGTLFPPLGSGFQGGCAL